MHDFRPKENVINYFKWKKKFTRARHLKGTEEKIYAWVLQSLHQRARVSPETWQTGYNPSVWGRDLVTTARTN